MSIETIIRAWKDPSFRSTLSAEQLAALPANPAGAIELSDEELGGVSGGAETCTPNGSGLRTLFGSRKQTCCACW